MSTRKIANDHQIVNIANDHQKRVNEKLDYFKKKTHDPVADVALSFIEKGTNLISKEDAFTQKFSSSQSLKDAKGLTGKVKALAGNYDSAVKKLDKVSIKTGEGAYYCTKLALVFLSRFRVGRIIQETAATAVGLVARLAVKVVEYVLRLLPYLAITVGLVFGGYKLGLAYLALFAFSKVLFAGALTTNILVVGLLAQQMQIQRLFSVIKKQGQKLTSLNSKLTSAAKNTSKSLSQRVSDFLSKHTGKIALGVAVAGVVGYVGLNGVPIFVTEALNRVGAFVRSL